MVGGGTCAYGIVLSLDDIVLLAGRFARPTLGIGTGHGEDP